MRTVFMISLIVCLVIIPGCRKDDYQKDPTIEIVKFKGQFEQNSEDPLSANNITINSITDKSGISSEGNFELESVENEKYQLFIGTSNASDETTYFGISDPYSGEVLVNDSTTALGLLLINPYLMGTEQEQRKEYLDQAVKEDKFPLLIKAIVKARKSYPNDPLNIDQQPEIYQMVNDILMSTIEKLASNEPDLKYGEKTLEIIDLDNNKVGFKNYRHVFYAADIFYPLKNSTETLLLSRREKEWKWKWRWPPWKSGFVTTKAPQTNCNVDDGIVNLDFYKFNVSTFSNSSYTAVDQATLLNTVYLIAYSLDMVCGIKGYFDEKTKLNGLSILLQAEPSFLDLQVAVAEGDNGDVMSALFSLLISDVGLTILSDYLSIKNVDPFFISKTAKAANVVLKLYDLYGYLNEHIPFIVDIVDAPSHLSYQYSSHNGILSLLDNNLPPEAKIAISPAVGFGETPITFTVTDYIDDITPIEDALFSWKWIPEESSNAEEWSDWARNPDTVMTISVPGRMYLKVSDQMEGEFQTNKELKFYESIERNRIIVLAAMNNYDYRGFLTDSLGFEGDQDSDLKYILTYPDESCDLPGQFFSPDILNPETDLLVIDPSVEDYHCNGQETGNPVMDAYTKNQLAILNFVRNGGNLLFITSWDTGYEGNIVPLSITSVSGNKVIRTSDTNRQFINGNECFMYTGIGFNNVPDKSLVHLVNENNAPLLVEINNGQGLILNSVFRTFYTGKVGEPYHHPVNINTFKYMIGANYK
nr:hypothetical protein [uncultured Carboxylicivirga sp.]